MGATPIKRVTDSGRICLVYDSISAALHHAAHPRAQCAPPTDYSLQRVTKPRAGWIVVPPGVAGATVEQPGVHGAWRQDR